MKKINIKALVLLIWLFAFSFLNSANVLASRKFALSPMSQRIVLIPGETYHGGITVAVPSDANDNFDYIVTLAPYSFERNETSDTDFGGSDFDTITDYNQIINWITLENAEGTLAPNEQVTVSFTVEVPDDAPAGGQYAALLVRENSGETAQDDAMAIREIMQMAHIIYAEVAGETRKEGDILDNSIPGFSLSPKLVATSVVKNNGNIHTDVEYILQVWPLFSNEEICTNEENSTKSMVMPGNTKYHNEECNLPAVGIFRAKQIVKIFGETSIVEKTVIVCPLWLLFLIIFGIAAIIIYFVTRAKARKKNAE